MGRFPKGSWKFDGCKGSFFLRGDNNIIWYRRSRNERFSTGLVYNPFNRNLAGQRIKQEETSDFPAKKGTITIQKGIELYLGYAQNRTTESTRAIYKRHLTSFVSNLDWLITDPRIKEAIEEIKNSDSRRSTIVSKLTSIRGFFNFLIEQKLIKENPINPTDFPKIEPRVIEIYTKHELDRLFTYSKKNDYQFYLFLLFLYKTAFRITEALELTVGNVKVDNVWRDKIIIGFSKYKNKIDTFPLTPAIQEILQQTNSINSTDSRVRIFNFNKSRRDLTKYLNTMLEECKIPKSTIGSPLRTGRLFHTLRKTRITEWIKQGISVHGLEMLSRDNYITVRKYYDAVASDNYDEFVK